MLRRDEAPLPVAAEIFTEKEIAIIRAYRARPDMQSAVEYSFRGSGGANIAAAAASVVAEGEKIFGAVRTESK